MYEHTLSLDVIFSEQNGFLLVTGLLLCIFLHSDIFFSSITRLDRNESRAQTFRYRSLLSKQNQNIQNWSAYYRNKSRTFQSVQKLFKIEAERFGVFLKFKNKTRTKPSQFLIGSKRFHTPMLQKKTKRNFCELFPNFFTSSERFCLLQAAQESKQNFCIFKK